MSRIRVNLAAFTPLGRNTSAITAENLQGSKIIMILLSGNVKNNIYLFFDTE